MNGYEVIRLLCYTISAPTLLYLALAQWRSRRYAQAMFYLSISFLFAWFVFEASVTSSGASTREIRFLATPFVVAATVSVVMMAAKQADLRRKLAAWKGRHERHDSLGATAG